jgi:hypothetical protein
LNTSINELDLITRFKENILKEFKVEELQVMISSTSLGGGSTGSDSQYQ